MSSMGRVKCCFNSFVQRSRETRMNSYLTTILWRNVRKLLPRNYCLLKTTTVFDSCGILSYWILLKAVPGTDNNVVIISAARCKSVLRYYTSSVLPTQQGEYQHGGDAGQQWHNRQKPRVYCFKISAFNFCRNLTHF